MPEGGAKCLGSARCLEESSALDFGVLSSFFGDVCDIMHIVSPSSGARPCAHVHRTMQSGRGSASDIVVLSAADSELSMLSVAFGDLRGEWSARKETPSSLRLISLLELSDEHAVDVCLKETLCKARLVIVRLLGGYRYWSHGVDKVVACCRTAGIKLAFLPGDSQDDPHLRALSVLPEEDWRNLWTYLSEGGPHNARAFLDYAHCLVHGCTRKPALPKPFLQAGFYWPQADVHALSDFVPLWKSGELPEDEKRTVAVIFYRSLLQSGDLEPVDALIAGLVLEKLRPLPIWCSSLRNREAASFVSEHLRASDVCMVLNLTSFSVSGVDRKVFSPLNVCSGPVLQVLLASTDEKTWQRSTQGLLPRDLIMQIALPEVDGRITTRAISFKSRSDHDPHAQLTRIRHRSDNERVGFVCKLARAWRELAQVPNHEKVVSLVLHNYPPREGRIANGVGLDSPRSAHVLLESLAQAGYRVDPLPRSGNHLIRRLLRGPTNMPGSAQSRDAEISWDLESYRAFWQTLPIQVRTQVSARWGEPQQDPFFHRGAFRLPCIRCTNLYIGIQPSRGHHIDPAKSHHDPELVPPHGYLAFYGYLRTQAKSKAFVHLGKHGNLEWLPGKALALSARCYPEAVFGPVPNIYPFIVNDPGEGSQAKRRTQAVIIDHLTPPMTRAGVYGPLARIEQLLEEYEEARSFDSQRRELIRQDILDLAHTVGLDQDCRTNECGEGDLAVLENRICDIKGMQIRDGLHVFGRSPRGGQEHRMLQALTRIPVHGAQSPTSVQKALAEDLEMALDVEDVEDLRKPYTASVPSVLLSCGLETRRGSIRAVDCMEALENLSLELISGRREPLCGWLRTRSALEFVRSRIAPRLSSCGADEIAGCLRALEGGFVAPGPSGAPTRGRLDVLPTGRNFYSVDTRRVPTSAAWTLGWRSAQTLLHRHHRTHGRWLKRVALSAWGTSNMRTGGEDIAQALAFLGVKPRWQDGSGRVSGFEVLSLSTLGRPRVDVTLKISGFFRDAFPEQIGLLDSAVRAVSVLSESEAQNPLAAEVSRETSALMDAGHMRRSAFRRASFRIFGARPGSYGAGLQTLIDEGNWSEEAELASAFLNWGAYAYGSDVGDATDEDTSNRAHGSGQEDASAGNITGAGEAGAATNVGNGGGGNATGEDTSKGRTVQGKRMPLPGTSRVRAKLVRPPTSETPAAETPPARTPRTGRTVQGKRMPPPGTSRVRAKPVRPPTSETPAAETPPARTPRTGRTVQGKRMPPPGTSRVRAKLVRPPTSETPAAETPPARTPRTGRTVQGKRMPPPGTSRVRAKLVRPPTSETPAAETPPAERAPQERPSREASLRQMGRGRAVEPCRHSRGACGLRKQ